MQRANVTIFLMAVGLIGLAPLLLVVVSVARRRIDRDPQRQGMSRSFIPIVAAITTVLVVGGGIAAWTFSEPAASSASVTGSDGMTGMTGMTGPAGMTGMTGMTGSAGTAGGTTTTAASGSAIPMELADVPLTSYVDGPQAIADVARLHGSSFIMTDAEIAIYGEGLATIWRSGTPDAPTAADQVERMRARIARGGTPFDAPHAVGEQPGVYATFGMGQEHFFFARGASVWWVAVEPSIAERALSEASGAST